MFLWIADSLVVKTRINDLGKLTVKMGSHTLCRMSNLGLRVCRRVLTNCSFLVLFSYIVFKINQKQSVLTFWTTPKKIWQQKKEEGKRRRRNTKKILKLNFKQKIKYPITFFSLHGNDDTILITQEIKCLLYVGFLKRTLASWMSRNMHKFSVKNSIKF